MSESKNMSSPYAVLDNRSLDQWKVTELKEELKRRKLMTKGLKDDLIKRLDEALRAESEEANQNHDNGVDDVIQPVVEEKTTSTMDDNSANDENLEENIIRENDKNESLEKDKFAEKLDNNESTEKDNITENLDDENKGKMDVTEAVSTGMEGFLEASVETSVLVSGESKPESESPKEEVKPNSSPIGVQVHEVSQVVIKSDSISVDSITETNEIKDNIKIADDVKLELEVKPENEIDGGITESIVVDEPPLDNFAPEEKDVNNEDEGSPEKLNLDRSSGDDSMEEDGLESKQIDSKFNQEISDVNKKVEMPIVKEDEHVDVMVEDTPATAKNTQSIKDNTDTSVGPTKRKLHDQETVTNNTEVVKRQRRWNPEGIKVSEQQTTNLSPSTTPRDTFHPSLKRSFSRSDSSVSHEEPKERIVPPSPKTPTTSLRIDRFLRPFTLKAVQELLGKTGTVVSFWMDHIKTHCYVTYSSVEEAVETRNAVYNLQWPTNGGRLLIAEFVDPSEVKARTEAPPPSPVTPATPTLPPPPHAAAQPPPQQQLPPPPPLPLPPPPPLSLPPQSREPITLPPPPPLPEKMDPPIVTLDDLFRKTRATPRIYYLPLSDEQVAAKLGRSGKQSAGRTRRRWRWFCDDRFRFFSGLLNVWILLPEWIQTKNTCSLLYFSDIDENCS